MEENATVSDPLIFIITGTIRKANSTEMIPFNALLSAPDDNLPYVAVSTRSPRKDMRKPI